MTDLELFKLIEEKQIQLNNITFPDWKSKLSEGNWKAAIIVEIGEALDSLGHTTKWWKKNDVDLENVKVELIDILHFSISLLTYVKDVNIEEYNASINGFLSMFHYDNFSLKEEIIRDNLVMLSSLIFLPSEFMARLAILFKNTGFNNVEEVFKAYMIKNTLNEFRQKHGYKQGTYEKQWVFKELYGDSYLESKVEDNVVAFSLAKTIEANDEFANTLYNELEKIYLNLK